MFFVPHALATWALAVWLIEWRRLRELIVYGWMGSAVASMQNVLGFHTGLWIYRDSGSIDTHAEINVLISLSAAPLLTMYFIQGFTPGQPFPWRRILVFTGVSMLPELVGLYTGHVIHGSWWHWWYSVLAYLFLWSAFWAFYRWMTAPKR